MQGAQANLHNVRESAYDASCENRQNFSKSGIRWSRYVGNPRGVFSSFMFLLRRLAMPHMRRGDLKTRHFFFPRKGVNRETKCGKGKSKCEIS